MNDTADGRYSENLELVRLAQNGDDEAFEKLIVQNTPLVRSIAVKFKGRGTELDDLIQIGMMGMVKAVRSFDFSRNTAFSTYAVPLIVGEIRRHLRDDGIIRVSRIYKKIGADLMRERNRICVEEGREPGIVELAKLCGVSAEEAAVALDASAPVVSLSDSAFGEDRDSNITLESVIPDSEGVAAMELLRDRMSIAQSISRMPPMWKKILLFRYFRGKTQQETANELGLTQVKVSREEKKILTFLRQELA